MNRPDYPFGFRVVGPLTGARQLVDAAAAFSGHARCDARSSTDSECYLSAFQLGDEFRAHLERHNTPKGYAGPCWGAWLWLDVDRDDPAAALHDARRLVGFALERYPKLDEDDVLTFFSGRKGYHVGVPLTHNPEPSAAFHLTAGRLAAGWATGAGVRIDTSIYDRVRPFRAPNSRHPKSGLHKRRVSTAELMSLSPARLAELAREPAPFDVPVVGELSAELETDWNEAAELVARERVAHSGRPHPGRLQRDTTEFVRAGADVGERHTRLFRAAADMAELVAAGGPDALIAALLTDPALDSGLAPGETDRQIRCGIDHARRQQSGATEGGAA